MKFIIHWLVSTLVIIAVAYLLPGVHVSGIIAALAAALVIGLLNAFVRPVLIVLTLPITLVTLGLFTIVINAVLVLLASAIVPGFVVDGFGWAILFSIVMGLVNILFHRR